MTAYFIIEFSNMAGGLLHSVYPLCKRIKLPNVSIVALVPKQSEVYKHFSSDGINTKEVGVKDGILRVKKPIRSILILLAFWKALKNKKNKQDLIFCNDIGSLMIATILHLKQRIVFISRGGDYKGKTGWFVKKLCFPKVFHFIAISERQRNILIKKGVQQNNITIIHNGVSLENKYSKINNETYNIGVVGFFSELKNQELIIKAFPKIKQKISNARILLYGVAGCSSDMVYKKKLESLIEQLNCKDDILFMGYKPKEEIYSNIDLMVSTSKSEGFGRTIVEAMASKIPAIAMRDAGGPKDIITHMKDGVLIDNFSQSQLEDVVIEFYDNKKFKNSIVNNAYEKYLKMFTEEKMIAEYEKFLKNLE